MARDDRKDTGGAVAPSAPLKLRLTAPYAYWTDDETPRLRSWSAGTVVEGEDAADLQGRGAPVEIVAE